MRNEPPDLLAEMKRVLIVLERAESDPAIWEKLTAGTGLATLNGFRAALTRGEIARRLAVQNRLRVKEPPHE